MGQAFDLMPISERVRRYREMAAAACDLADGSKSMDSKADYLRLASAWHRIATELECELLRLPGEWRLTARAEQLSPRYFCPRFARVRRAAASLSAFGISE